jgi:hypothetical protein
VPQVRRSGAASESATEQSSQLPGQAATMGATFRACTKHMEMDECWVQVRNVLQPQHMPHNKSCHHKELAPKIQNVPTL